MHAETAAATQDEATDDAETATTTHDEASDDGSDGADEPLELVIVGAGPHALALLLRLLDDAPDESGDFFVGLGSAPRSSRKSWSDLEKRRCGDDVARRVLDRVRVVDGSGAWLGTWDAQFAALEIPHLRSTYDQHPCPYDSFALQQFVVKNGRERDVVDLSGAAKRKLRAQKAAVRDLKLDEVLAEAADAGYDSYVGHHFPASDIPQQARALYLVNHFRLIADANYSPVPLVSNDAALAPAGISIDRPWSNEGLIIELHRETRLEGLAQSSSAVARCAPWSASRSSWPSRASPTR